MTAEGALKRGRRAATEPPSGPREGPAGEATGQDRPAGRLERRLRTVAVMLVTGAVLLGIAYFANGTSNTAGNGVTTVDITGTPAGPAPIVGQAAPDVSGTTVDGKPFRLGELKGSPVWLSFGATWCQPCRAENPDIEAAYQEFRARGLVVVQMYIGEDQATVADYTGRVGLTYTKVPDSAEKAATEYRILGIPSHFFIDRNGVLTQLKVGTLDRETMEAILGDLVR